MATDRQILCNVVKVKYDKEVNMVAEERVHSNMSLTKAINTVFHPKAEPMYLYVVGSENTEKYNELKNAGCKREYKKVID